MPVPRGYLTRAKPLEREALEALSAPERYPLLTRLGRLDRVVFQLGQFPSFSVYTTWALVQKPDGYFVRRVVWDRSTNPQTTTSPLLYGSEGQLPTEPAEALASEFHNLSVPLSPFQEPLGLGLDGTRYSLATDRFKIALTLSWWESGPPGWEPLAQCHTRAVELFEAHLPPTTREQKG
ncbi:MAG: hypothetical protein QM758_07280 [Armatimonas sp.]